VEFDRTADVDQTTKQNGAPSDHFHINASNIVDCNMFSIGGGHPRSTARFGRAIAMQNRRKAGRRRQ
jgi:hypothetical protein